MELQNRLKEIIKTGKLKREELLSEHTTFRIGGPANYFIEPANEKELSELLFFCQTEKLPYYILGNGSNVLVGDGGFQGLIIHIGEAFSKIIYEKTEQGILVTAGAGILLSKLANDIAKNKLTGFEFASGIPGTLGGAVTMNAGAYDGEIKDFIVSVKALDRYGKEILLQKDQMRFGYRQSIIQDQSYIVIEASFCFQESEQEKVYEKIKELNQRRREKQPLEYPSAGSTFKRPEGYFAAKLIMDAGLRGYTIGDAMVSEKHCGFVINKGNGSAKEVKELINHITKTVHEKYGVVLEPEVRFIGEFE